MGPHRGEKPLGRNGASVGQVLGQAIEATKSLDQQKLADYIRATEFSTIVGKVKFGKNGVVRGSVRSAISNFARLLMSPHKGVAMPCLRTIEK